MTSRAARLELANQGIPWRPAEAAEALELLPPSVARTLAALEARRLVFCWATGEGRGRRVSHIKLTHAAERLADEQERYGMSQQQRSRQHAAEYRARREAAELAEMEERWPTPEAEAWTDEPYATGGRT